MEKYSVFRNYEPGDPNCRIYVKNLAKQVQEKVSKQANTYQKGFFLAFILHLLFNFRILSSFLEDMLTSSQRWNATCEFISHLVKIKPFMLTSMTLLKTGVLKTAIFTFSVFLHEQKMCYT